MNGFHFANIGRWLAALPRGTRYSGSRRMALSTGLTVLGLVVICLAWHAGRGTRYSGSSCSGSDGQPRAVQVALTDAPSWEQERPGWPMYLPQPPAAAPSAAARSGQGTADGGRELPSTDHQPPSTALSPAALPSIVAGPDLFAPPIQPVLVAQKVVGCQLPVVSLRTDNRELTTDNSPAPLPARLPATRPLRSETMEKIATQSDQQIRHGFELASRGAYFAARAEFTAALRLVAQGLDNERNTTLHSQALSTALTAMKEAQDFIPAGGKLEGELDLPPLVAGHRTPVLKHVPPEQLQAMRALKQYFTFAQEQLALAAGEEVSGSMALGALGKMHAALAAKPNPDIVAPEPKAIVFFQAAILVCPRNYIAANDLGVLLARNGDYAGARRVLEHSVLVFRSWENLNNLSVVYRHVGQQRLAELAAQKAQAAKAAELARQKSARLSADGTVEWVDPAALAQSPDQWADPPAARSGQGTVDSGRQLPSTNHQPPSTVVLGPTTIR